MNYDGSGQRMAMQSTVSGTVTTTAYIGNIEEVQTSGSTTQTTTYYTVNGKRIAAAVNGTFYYLGYDVLGSKVVVLNATGSVIGSQLYGPYGSSRYSNGTLPTSIGFTGQRQDSVTGLEYYNARYYDPTVGQFLSADTVQGNSKGMNPYGYVEDNPETKTDPTGHWAIPWGVVGELAVDVGIGAIAASIAITVGIAAITAWGWLANTQHLSCGCVGTSNASVKAIAADIGRSNKPSAWSGEQKDDIVASLSSETAKNRAAAIAKYNKMTQAQQQAQDDPRKANAAMAILYIWGKDGREILNATDFELGFRGAPHSEALLVEWAEGLIKSKAGQLDGATINLMIYSQTTVCPTCRSSMNTWLSGLYSNTGLSAGHANVNMDVYEGMGANLRYVYTGYTNGITTTSQFYV